MAETHVKSAVFTRSFFFLTIAAITALGVLIALGSWQVKRLSWKEALIARVEAQIASPPVPLEDVIPAQTELRGTDNDIEYQPVSVVGTFDHSKEYFYFATLDGASGFHVYTPLKINAAKAASPSIVFVNRGFVPDDKKAQETRPDSLTSGEVTITGLFRWPDVEKPNSFIPDNDVEANIFFWRELALMRNEAGYSADELHPFFVYENKKIDVSLPVGGVTIIDFPNSHLAYAITWYGLALTLIGVYGALLIGRVKGVYKERLR
ncbi:MAG: SURF1 family protein [Hyphomicrobiales bacterium]